MPSAAILAGGRARRYAGRDKGGLIIEGQTIRARQLAMLSGLTDDILVVSDTPVAGIDGLARGIADQVPGRGPLGGLHAALTAARHDRLVVLAGDMPFVSEGLLQHMLTLADQGDVVVPRTKRGYHPLCAVYRRVVLPAVECRLKAESLALKDLLDDLRVRLVEGEELLAFGDPERLLANVNTPEDYERLGRQQIHEL
jgi:molybdopterin-guanine dinucleotide biosynthesis protein A